MLDEETIRAQERTRAGIERMRDALRRLDLILQRGGIMTERVERRNDFEVSTERAAHYAVGPKVAWLGGPGRIMGSVVGRVKAEMKARGVRNGGHANRVGTDEQFHRACAEEGVQIWLFGDDFWLYRSPVLWGKYGAKWVLTEANGMVPWREATRLLVEWSGVVFVSPGCDEMLSVVEIGEREVVRF